MEYATDKFSETLRKIAKESYGVDVSIKKGKGKDTLESLFGITLKTIENDISKEETKMEYKSFNLPKTTPDRVALAAPWVKFRREIEELFEKDPEIRIECDEYASDFYDIRLYVDNTDKAQALMQLLPSERVFGNVTARVIVIPANKENPTKVDLLKAAFKNNNAVTRIVTIDDVMSNPVTYCAFAKTVVQYPLDNLHDINGNVSTLYENIARDIFGEDEGICFCTDHHESYFDW